MLFSEHSKIQLSQLNAYNYTKIKTYAPENPYCTFVKTEIQFRVTIAQSLS